MTDMKAQLMAEDHGRAVINVPAGQVSAVRQAVAMAPLVAVRDAQFGCSAESGLFCCFKDLETCLCGLFCPCVLFGINGKRASGGQRGCFSGCLSYCLVAVLACMLALAIASPAINGASAELQQGIDRCSRFLPPSAGAGSGSGSAPGLSTNPEAPAVPMDFDPNAQFERCMNSVFRRVMYNYGPQLRQADALSMGAQVSFVALLCALLRRRIAAAAGYGYHSLFKGFLFHVCCHPCALCQEGRAAKEVQRAFAQPLVQSMV